MADPKIAADAANALADAAHDLAAVVKYDREALTEDELAALSEATSLIRRVRFRLAAEGHPK